MSSSAEVIETICEIYAGVIDDLLNRGYTPEHLCKLAHSGNGKSAFTGRRLGQRPERYVEERVIWPTLNALGLDYRTEVYCPTENVYYDLEIRREGQDLYGEVKPFGKIEKAKWDIIAYLGKGIADTKVGLATDGLTWWIFETDLDVKIKKPNTLCYFDFEEFIIHYVLSQLTNEQLSQITSDPTNGWWVSIWSEDLDRKAVVREFVSQFKYNSNKMDF